MQLLDALRQDPYFLIGLKRAVRRTHSCWRMTRLDRRDVPSFPGELRAFVAVRNEMLRLPFFLTYYRALGVDRFLVIDNGSADGTVEFLLSQSDVHLFRTPETFLRKEAWLDSLLRRFGVGHWCLILDADELVLYPHADRISFRNLTTFLDANREQAFHTLLVDMYPRQSLGGVNYRAGTDFRHTANYFDAPNYHSVPFSFRNCEGRLSSRFEGGVRERVFNTRVCCTNFPLIRFCPAAFVRDGRHAVEGVRISELRGALLHFKFLQDFKPRAILEAERGVHYDQAAEYKRYVERLGKERDICLWNADALRYQGPRQLLDLNIMQSTPAWDRWVEKEA